MALGNTLEHSSELPTALRDEEADVLLHPHLSCHCLRAVSGEHQLPGSPKQPSADKNQVFTKVAIGISRQVLRRCGLGMSASATTLCHRIELMVTSPWPQQQRQKKKKKSRVEPAQTQMVLGNSWGKEHGMISVLEPLMT